MHCFGLEILKDQLKPGIYSLQIFLCKINFIFSGAKVLDVGSGSGYLTACMARLVRPGGKAIGVDHIQELVDKSITNIKKNNKELFDDGSLEIHKCDGRQGYAAEAPYDAIHVGAAAPDTPHELIRQLKVGGRLVSPVGGGYGQEMITYDKKSDGSYHEQRHMGVMYVPLTDEQKQYASAGIRKDL
jgi:protein-L-isoaspartate(D-aspartate) O-methyltransferase